MTDYIIKNEADRKELIDSIRSMSLDKPKFVSIKTKRRTTKQNSLYWAWCTEIANFWSNKASDPPAIIDTTKDGKIFYVEINREVVHEYFARHLLTAEKRSYPTPAGRIKKSVIIKSTTDLSTVEMSEYMMKLRNIMMDVWNLVLETPMGNEFTQFMQSLESV